MESYTVLDKAKVFIDIERKEFRDFIVVDLPMQPIFVLPSSFIQFQGPLHLIVWINAVGTYLSSQS